MNTETATPPNQSPSRVTVVTGKTSRTVALPPEIEKLIASSTPYLWLVDGNNYTETELSDLGLVAFRAASSALGFVHRVEAIDSKLTSADVAALPPKLEESLDSFFSDLDMKMQFDTLEEVAERIAGMLHGQAKLYERLRRARVLLDEKGVNPAGVVAIDGAEVRSRFPKSPATADEFDFASWTTLFIGGVPLSMTKACVLYEVLLNNGYTRNEIASAVGNALVEIMTA